jgi:hypothetical protein
MQAVHWRASRDLREASREGVSRDFIRDAQRLNFRSTRAASARRGKAESQETYPGSCARALREKGRGWEAPFLSWGFFIGRWLDLRLGELRGRSKPRPYDRRFGCELCG